MTDLPSRRPLIFGNTAQFQTRNPHISTVRWRTMFREEYGSEHDVRIAQYAWDRYGKTFFANEISRGDKRILRRALFQERRDRGLEPGTETANKMELSA